MRFAHICLKTPTNLWEANMKKIELEKKVALLESMNDQLETELCYVDSLMRLVGFAGGLASVKTTALELIEAPDASDPS